jgi:glutathione synthase/RimK-type ligase-like ATP-grasp enzyme
MALTVALVTMDPRPRDVDHPLLGAALAKRHIETVDVAWTDAFDYTQADLAVIRSTWNYHHQHQAFVGWARRVPKLHNPASIIEWNSDKHYLHDLESRGVPVIPTAYVKAGARIPLIELCDARGWNEAVVKPTISGGAHLTKRFVKTNTWEAEQTLGEILKTCDAMVQPYLKSVETSLERSLVYIDGVFAHAVRREPVLITKQFIGTLAAPAEDERWVAETVLRAVPEMPLLYARVDLARDDSGALCLMELELIEPHMYIQAHPLTEDLLAEAIERRALAYR